MAAASDQHTNGTAVWYYDDKSTDGWVPGIVVKTEGNKLLVKTEGGGTVSLTPEQCPLQNPGSLRGVEVGTPSPCCGGKDLGRDCLTQPSAVHLSISTSTSGFDATSGIAWRGVGARKRQ